MSRTALALLRAHLDQLEAQGRVRVPLTQEGRQALRHLVTEPLRTRQPVRPSAPVVEELPPPMEPLLPPVPVVAPADVIDVPGTTLEEKLANLAAMADEDPVPRQLGSLRTTMVFAVGDPHSPLMFVGEAPGSEEERQREPFVGPAGQLLTKIIAAMGLKREGVYITNVCKFRPSLGEFQGSKNRNPTAEEMQSCIRYLRTEIALIQPKLIVALGATAAMGLGIEGTVGRMRQQTHQFSGTPVIVTYHPSYVLRQEADGRGNEAKRQVWEDMMRAMEKLDMPISEKQRGFFKGK